MVPPAGAREMGEGGAAVRDALEKVAHGVAMTTSPGGIANGRSLFTHEILPGSFLCILRAPGPAGGWELLPGISGVAARPAVGDVRAVRVSSRRRRPERRTATNSGEAATH